jgi:hypothetical protein
VSREPIGLSAITLHWDFGFSSAPCLKMVLFAQAARAKAGEKMPFHAISKGAHFCGKL